MRSTAVVRSIALRPKAITVFVLLTAVGLVASSCGGNDDENSTSDSPASEEDSPAASDTTVPPSTIRPPLTTSSTIPATTTTTSSATGTDTSAESGAAVGTGTGLPPVPTNLKCLAGTSTGELLVEWDAPEDTTDISKVHLYVSVEGGPFITNSAVPLSQVDTDRSNGTRWAYPVSGVPADKPLRLAVTTRNALNQESGWYPLKAHYISPGEACGSGDPTPPTTTTTPPAATTTLPPPTCTAGCE